MLYGLRSIFMFDRKSLNMTYSKCNLKKKLSDFAEIYSVEVKMMHNMIPKIRVWYLTTCFF